MSSASPIRGVIFDKDATLLEFEMTWIGYIERMLNKIAPDEPDQQSLLCAICGFDPIARDFKPGSLIVGGSIEELCAKWADQLPNFSTDQLLELSEAIVFDLDPQPLCDLENLMSSLISMGITIGLVTNDLENAADLQLKNANIRQYFSFVAGCDSGFLPKPSPQSILKFCDEFDISPSTLVVVGDSRHDLLAAKSASAKMAIGVLTGPATRDDLDPIADHILTNAADLPAFLSQYS